jgi:type II secretory pathway pseudopilin PulG
MTTLLRLRRRTDETGFTLVEVSITALLLGMVMSAIFGLLAGQVKLEQKVGDFANNQEAIREALVLMQRDLRSSEPLVQLPSPLDYRWRVDLQVYQRVTDADPVVIRWEIVPGATATTDQLVRSVIKTDGTTSTTYRLRGVMTQRQGRYLFQYFKRDGNAYDLTASGTTTGSMVACTVRLKIDISAAPEGDTSKAPRLISDVQLRNWVPGAVGCP